MVEIKKEMVSENIHKRMKINNCHTMVAQLYSPVVAAHTQKISNKL